MYLSFTIILTRLHDLHHLQILYPNKRKDEVFGKYYAPPRKSFCCVLWMDVTSFPGTPKNGKEKLVHTVCTRTKVPLVTAYFSLPAERVRLHEVSVAE